MTQVDKQAFATAIMGMAELYERELSEAAIELWWRALEAHDIMAIATAFATHMKDPEQGHWMPKPADILQHIAGGKAQDLAAMAWSKVEKAIYSIGAYQTVVFDDTVTMMALGDLGSWPDLCHSTENEMPFRAKDFQRLYAAYMHHPKTEYPRALPGIAETGNEAAGYQGSPPVLIGNRKKALAIWNEGRRIEAIEPPTRTVWTRPEKAIPAPGQQRSVTHSVMATQPDTEPHMTAEEEERLLAEARSQYQQEAAEWQQHEQAHGEEEARYQDGIDAQYRQEAAA